jgi:hypothetical protein
MSSISLDRRLAEIGTDRPEYETPRNPLFPTDRPWPKCSSSEMFIWEAINHAGSHVLGAEWEGSEMDALDWPISPKRALEAARERRRKNWEAIKASSTVRNTAPAVPPINASKHYDQHLIARSRHAFQLRLGAEQSAWETNQAAVARIRRASDWLEQRFRDGIIKTFTRFTKLAAAPHEMPASEWFCDDTFTLRVLPGQYKRWYYQPQARQYDVYIFVERASLDAALKIVAEPSVTGMDMDSLSPFLRLALRVAREKNITADNTGGKKQVLIDAIAELKAEYGLEDDLGKVATENLATFIRWPDAKKGRASTNEG